MSDSKLFFRAGEINDELVGGRREIFSRGVSTGFHVLDQIASFKPQSTTVIYSPPHVGKSVITMDILMSLAERGNNIFIYSPEFRKVGEVFQALIQTRMRVSFMSKKAEGISDDAYIDALNFVDKHFVVVQRPKRTKDVPRPKMTIKDIFNQCNKAQQAYGMKIHYIFADPFNYISKDDEQRMMQEQEYVLDANDMLAEFSETLGVHSIISAHTRDMELQYDKESGVSFYPVGHPSQIMGGQSWYRASYQILHLWRAPFGVKDPDGIPYPENYTKVFNQKAKPWGSGFIGNTSKFPGMDGLFFDPDTYTMYEIVQGRRYYRNEYYAANGGELEEQAAIPNIDEEESLF